MAKTGKKYLAASSKVADRPHDLKEALSVVKDVAFAKFDETVEIHMRLGVDPRQADQMVRGTIVLPHGTGKSMKVAVVANGKKSRKPKLRELISLVEMTLLKRLPEVSSILMRLWRPLT